MHGIDFIQDLAVVMLVAGLVGWACQRAGLSSVVGYLLAGAIIGPHTPPFSLVTDIERIDTLAQVGLVFLMFSVGMKLSLRKLRKLGFALVLATGIEAVLIYTFTRAAGGLTTLDDTETVFLAAMLMISSSAVISKVLADIGAGHEKTGQMAMGVFVVEDLIAVLLLTGLGSYASLAGAQAHAAPLGRTLMLLTAFVVLVAIVGVLFLPWLLKKLSLTGGAELPTLVQAGLLFVLATAAHKAGFSLALGAFLLGAIVADTPQRTQIDRTFEGLRDVFSAVFFVAIGMMIEPKALRDTWPLVLLVSGLALVGRAVACSAGLFITGSPTRVAVRVGLLVVPLGEFTFIIAQLGIDGGVLPANFQVVAVGAALLTALVAPPLARRSAAIADWCEERQPPWLSSWFQSYRGWLDRLHQRSVRNTLWQLSRRRLLQIGLELLLVTGLLAFSGPLLRLLQTIMPANWPFPRGPQVIFWSAVALAVLPPVVAIWRNLSALAMLVAEVAFSGLPAKGARFGPMFELALRLFGGVVLFLWLSAFLPVGGSARWVPLAVVAIVALALGFFRQKLIYWHSVLEVELQERLTAPTGATTPAWLVPPADWKMTLTECVLPDLADARGRTLGELELRARTGCTVAGVERQGVMVQNPPAHFALYPRDRVLLMGELAQTVAAKEMLTRVSGTMPSGGLEDVRLEILTLPPVERAERPTLAELAPGRRAGVQVVAINRGGHRLLNPGGEERLFASDELLVFGSAEQIAAFRASLLE